MRQTMKTRLNAGLSRTRQRILVWLAGRLQASLSWTLTRAMAALPVCENCGRLECICPQPSRSELQMADGTVTIATILVPVTPNPFSQKASIFGPQGVMSLHLHRDSMGDWVIDGIEPRSEVIYPNFRAGRLKN